MIPPDQPPAHKTSANHQARQHRRQRQIHPMFRDRLRHHRNDAGSRRQDRKEPRPQKTDFRPPPQRHHRGRPEQPHHDRIGHDLPNAMRSARAIVQQQWMGPHAQPQVVNDRAELRAKVCPPAYSHAKTGRASAVARGDYQPPQQQPRAGQGQVESAASSPGLAEGAGHKCPVVQQHDQRRGNHHLLAGHAQQAGQHRADMPDNRSGRIHAADEAIQRQQ